MHTLKSSQARRSWQAWLSAKTDALKLASTMIVAIVNCFMSIHFLSELASTPNTALDEQKIRREPIGSRATSRSFECNRIGCAQHPRAVPVIDDVRHQRPCRLDTNDRVRRPGAVYFAQCDHRLAGHSCGAGGKGGARFSNSSLDARSAPRICSRHPFVGSHRKGRPIERPLHLFAPEQPPGAKD